MQFNPTIHTKAFLVCNPEVACKLAEKSTEFARSDLVNDYLILSLIDECGGWTVAHLLAEYQSAWVNSEAVKNKEVLQLTDLKGKTVAYELARNQPDWAKLEISNDRWVLELKDGFGRSVAHALARCQPDWVNSVQAGNYDILKIADADGWSVAHDLAFLRPQWMSSIAAQDVMILRLKTITDGTVAHSLLSHEACLKHEALFSRDILTLMRSGVLLAEELVAEYGKSHGVELHEIIVRMICQGSAYKHSKTLGLSTSQSILDEALATMEDFSNPEVLLRQLIALYSTFHHNLNKILEENGKTTKFLSILGKVEGKIRYLLKDSDSVLGVEIKPVYFCEPGIELINRIKSEKEFSKIEIPIADELLEQPNLSSKIGLY